LLSVAFTAANAWTLFGKPSNYDECVIDAIKNKPSKTSGDDDYLTLGLITQSCRKLFPSKTDDKKSCTQRLLKPWEMYQLQWTGAEVTHLSSGSYFGAKFYNGTKDIRIAGVTIKISPPATAVQIDKNAKRETFTFEEAQYFDPQEYEVNLRSPVEPKEIGEIFKSVLEKPPAGWTWAVTSVSGCQ